MFYYCISRIFICDVAALLSVSNQLINTSRSGQNQRDFVPGKPVSKQFSGFSSFYSAFKNNIQKLQSFMGNPNLNL